VQTVVAYFEAFVERFPDLASLAAASVDDVLALWSGLGYYARARNLHRAARIVVERHGGALPSEHAALMELPGIGRSTAAAILALSSGQRHAILDGNVKRVLARFHAIEGWPGETAVSRRLWAEAEAHTPHERVAAYTQAIMDLGATLCTRARPRCDDCPLGDDCAARRAGNAERLPTPRPRRERPAREVTVVIVRSESGETLLERRPPAGIWGGLLSLPELAADDDPVSWCRERLGLSPLQTTSLTAVEHAFTHFDLTLKPVQLAIERLPESVMDEDRWLWYKASEPLPGGIAAPIDKILRQTMQIELLPESSF
jgi:A/G-specific adenine glycosylase